MKISTKILIGLCLFLVGGLFASNMILKKEYDNPNKKGRFGDYKTVLQQPFRHLKVENGKDYGVIIIMQGDKSEVRVPKTWTNFSLDTADKYVKNDTLFLKFTEKEKPKSYSYSSSATYVFAPEMLSVEGNNTEIQLAAFKQKTLDIRLSKNSTLDISREFSDLDFLKISLKDISQFNCTLMSERFSQHIIKAQTVEASLSDSSKLYMNSFDIKSLKLTSTPNNEIQLSSGTLQTLLKQ